jgi:germination protein M
MKGLRVFAIVVVLAACVGLGAYLCTGHKQPTPPPAPGPAPVVQTPAEPMKTVKVYQIEVKNNQAKLRATQARIPAAGSPIKAALRKLIEQGDGKDLANPIPKGTRLLGLKVRKGLATVNLSHEFRDNFTGGSEEEGLTIGAILRTLAQFPEVKQVEFMVEGKPLDTLGHLELSGPQDVHWTGSQFGGDN